MNESIGQWLSNLYLLPRSLSWVPNTWIKCLLYISIQIAHGYPQTEHVQSWAHFLLPKNLFLLFWLPYIYHSSHFLCFNDIPASYKHLHPPKPHWFNFLQFLDSMYMSTSLLKLWLRLFPVLTSLLTMFSILSLSFSSSPFSTLQPELSYRQVWWFIHLFNKYLLSPYRGPGVDLGIWDTVPTFGEFIVYD